MGNSNPYFCPNCWGYQEYKNHDCTPKVKVDTEIGWIQKYARKFLLATKN